MFKTLFLILCVLGQASVGRPTAPREEEMVPPSYKKQNDNNLMLFRQSQQSQTVLP